jgi:hypothetical protein
MSLDRIRHDIFARNILILGHKSPAALAKVPVNNRVRDEILKALELPSNEGSASPWARVAHIKVITALLGRVLCVGIARDPVSERTDLTLEFARGVAGLNPVGDFTAARL